MTEFTIDARCAESQHAGKRVRGALGCVEMRWGAFGALVCVRCGRGAADGLNSDRGDRRQCETGPKGARNSSAVAVGRRSCHRWLRSEGDRVGPARGASVRISRGRQVRFRASIRGSLAAVPRPHPMAELKFGPTTISALSCISALSTRHSAPYVAPSTRHPARSPLYTMNSPRSTVMACPASRTRSPWSVTCSSPPRAEACHARNEFFFS
jgi:hypothetical protein